MPVKICFSKTASGARTRGQLPPDLLLKRGARRQYCPLHSSTILTKQNACSVTCKCLCITVYQRYQYSFSGMKPQCWPILAYPKQKKYNNQPQSFNLNSLFRRKGSSGGILIQIESNCKGSNRTVTYSNRIYQIK